jgi:hypothetical protein
MKPINIIRRMNNHAKYARHHKKLYMVMKKLSIVLCNVD